MNILLALAIVVLAALLAATVMLLIRRRAPEGSYFADSDRAAGVFGALGAGYAILLGLVILMSFENFTSANDAARAEAVAVHEMYNSEHVFSPADQQKVGGDLMCYARAVVSDEWKTMEESGSPSATVDHWSNLLEGAVNNISVTGPKQQVNYADIVESAGRRESARTTRLMESKNTLPALFWLVLLTGAVAVVGYMFFWADSGERRVVQGMLVGSVTALVVSSLLLVTLLDSPIGTQTGKIAPTEMQHTIDIMRAETQANTVLPCNEQGSPT